MDKDTADILAYIVGAYFLGIGYLGSLGMLQVRTLAPASKNTIKNQDDLEAILEEESRALNIQNKKIIAKLNSEEISEIMHEKEPIIHAEHIIDLSNPLHQTREYLRYKLYHTRFENSRKRKNIFYQWLIAEPRATLYSLYGIRL